MKLVLDNIQAKDLVDRGSIIDIQDPALVIRVGDEEVKTQR